MIEKVAVDVLSRDGTMHPMLRAWLARHAPDYRVHCSNSGRAVARNASVKHFLQCDVPAGKELLIQLDNDLRPVASTINILTYPGPLVYCGAIGSEGHGHFGDGNFGAACCRMSADLLKKMQAPWFVPELSKDGSSEVVCECVSFRRQAKPLGYAAKMVGVVGHAVEAIATPNDKGEAVLTWPPERNQ